MKRQISKEGLVQGMGNRTYGYGGRVKRRKSIRAFLALILALAVVLSWFWSFFKVQSVEVTGTTHYSKEQIEDIFLQGPMAENSVLAPLFCSRDQTEEISFIDAVDVSYVDPGSILITVTEKQSVGCVRYLDCYIYFDREGTAIESSVEKEDGVLYFEGIELGSVCLEQPLFAGDESFLRAAVSLSQMTQKGMRIPDRIQLDRKDNFTLTYGDISVKLGKARELDDKIDRMGAILPMLEGKKGILHLENVTSEKKTVTFEEDK